MKLNEIIKTREHRLLSTKEEIEDWLYANNITHFEVDDDLIVNVNNNVNFYDKEFKYFPVNFGEVRGSFTCRGNGLLRSLNGAPHSVSGDFTVTRCNALESLEGGPHLVSGEYMCNYNKSLESLHGAPEQVESFDCRFCPHLESLEGAPDVVHGSFRCDGCESLMSLKDVPKFIGGTLSIEMCYGIKDYLQVFNTKGLQRLRIGSHDTASIAAAKIVNEHLKTGNIFSCQQALMDAGLEGYAEL